MWRPDDSLQSALRLRRWSVQTVVSAYRGSKHTSTGVLPLGNYPALQLCRALLRCSLRKHVHWFHSRCLLLRRRGCHCVQVMGESCRECRHALPAPSGLVGMVWLELCGPPAARTVLQQDDEDLSLCAPAAAAYFHRTVRERCSDGGRSLPPLLAPEEVCKEALLYKGGSMIATVQVWRSVWQSSRGSRRCVSKHFGLPDDGGVSRSALGSIVEEVGRLWQLRSRWVPELLGVAACQTPFTLVLVSTHYELGDLVDVLLGPSRHSDHRPRCLPELQLNTRRSLAHQAAAALSWVHSHGMCHRDVKSQNYLVRAQHRQESAIELCLGDFGECVPMDELKSSTWAEEGLIASMGYTAPELLATRPPPYSQAADVWGLGVVLWEILTQSCVHDGAVPWGVSAHEDGLISESAVCKAALRPYWSLNPLKPEVGDNSSLYSIAQYRGELFNSFVRACSIPFFKEKNATGCLIKTFLAPPALPTGRSALARVVSILVQRYRRATQ